MNRKTHYPIIHTQIKIFTVSSEDQKVCIDKAVFGSIPERILIDIVKNVAFVGSTSTNQFHIHHYDKTHICYMQMGFSTFPSHS